jgi:hypothetical protein
MAFTFDGANKLVVCSTGTTSIDLADLWSRWKDWLLQGNAGYARAFDTVGGDPIDPVAGTLVPLYLFVQNGWKLRPQEADHTLNVTGGSIVVSGGGDPFVSTLGDYTVRINYQQPVQAMGYSTGGGTAPSASEVADAVWQHASATSLLTKVDMAQAILRNKTITDPNTGLMVVYDIDGTTPLLTAAIYQDAAGSTPYQGQGAERRELLEPPN